MLLSINEDKIAEMLESSTGAYAVTGLDISTEIDNTQPQLVSVEISGVVYATPAPVTTAIKERLIGMRHEIEASGVPLKSANELTKEIDEMRGRG